MNEQQNAKGLDRYLHRVDVWAIGFGCMVGWGAFVMPGTTFLPIAGPLGSLIAMVIGALVMLIVASSISFLMEHTPRTGGLYSYTKQAFGRDHAFLCSWFLCLSYLTVVFLNGSALFVVIRTVLGERIQSGFHYTVGENEIYLKEVLTSAAVLGAVGVLFVVAKPILQRLHTVLAIILLAGVLVLGIVCLPSAFHGKAVTDLSSVGVSEGFGVFSLIILAPWAYVGFEMIAFDTAHFRFPTPDGRKIIVVSILCAAFSYCVMTLISVSAVPDGYASWQEYISALPTLSGVRSVPTFSAAKDIMGPAGLVIIAVTALSAILTGIIGAYRAMLRVLSTMAEDRILSEKFNKTSYSILFVMLLSILISLLGRNTLTWFVDLTSFGAIVAYGYTCAAAYRIAGAEGNRRAGIMGLIGAIIAVGLVTVQLVPRLAAVDAMGSEAFLLLSLWCLLGFVFYLRTIRESTLTEYSGMSASGTVLFALLVYAAILRLAKRLYECESIAEARSVLIPGGIVMMAVIFVGLAVMLYIQSIVRKKHEASEREKIRAVEGSLAKSRFLFNMSHDIRTPMNAILGYTALAQNETDIDAIRDYLSKVDTSGKHLLSLINDLLEMSRIESGKTELHLEPSDLKREFEEIGDLFAEQMKQKGITFTLHDGEVSDRFVWCDRKNFSRVLLNVISNAYKFTPAGGSVTATLFETGKEQNGYASYAISVRDSGIGMSREFVDKMFTAFERERTSTDSGLEGTGLGLAITKSLVDLMGGTIDVMTSPGSGTELIIRLKLRLAEESELGSAAGVSSAPESPAQAADEIDFSQKRLLLVEDNMINLEIARMILTQQGFTVETAENGRIAVDKVAASEPGYYDAILMDIQMPVMDGYAATRAIRSLDNKALSGIPILAMTANAFEEDVQAAGDAGMQAHIAKPVDVNVLMGALRSVLK